MSAPSVALATSEGYATLPDDDRLLLDALHALGVRAEPCVWSRPSAWRAPWDLVVVRSCWDDHLRLGEFLAWLRALRSRGTSVLNPPAVIEWNARKRYLAELAEAGLPTIPTLLAGRGGLADAERRLAALAAGDAAWRTVVAKPEVSASAHGTLRAAVPFDDGARGAIAAQLEAGDVLVQPYVPSVAEHGELSVLFVGGAYSHAVLKRPAPGDFRVQAEHGGTAAPHPAPPAALALAERALAHVARAHGRDGGALLSARGDMLLEPEPRLMELELIEPSLFLAHGGDAAARLAAAVVAAIGRGMTGLRRATV